MQLRDHDARLLVRGLWDLGGYGNGVECRGGKGEGEGCDGAILMTCFTCFELFKA